MTDRSFVYFALIIIALLFAGLFFYKPDATSWVVYKPPPQSKYEPEKLESKDESLTLFFAGDVMLDRGIGDKIHQKEDSRWPFLKIASTTKQADLFFANLESVISDKGHNVGSKYSFRANPRAIEGLKYAGLDVVSVANNHSGDWTLAAFKDSLSRLQKAGISSCGGGENAEQAYRPTYLTAGPAKVAFFCYTDLGPKALTASLEKPGIAWLDPERLIADIEETAAEDSEKNPDIVVVSLHYGQEYATSSNQRQRQISRQAIEAGADLVIGHHPHVVQEIEQYKDGWIAYSLGNFIFDQLFSEPTRRGVLLKVIIDQGKIDSVTPLPTKITNEYQVIES